ncbi:hypothetical protein MAR_007402, partial [Mya arenaria]
RFGTRNAVVVLFVDLSDRFGTRNAVVVLLSDVLRNKWKYCHCLCVVLLTTESVLDEQREYKDAIAELKTRFPCLKARDIDPAES